MKPKEFMLYNEYDYVKYIFKVNPESDNDWYLDGYLYEVHSWDSETHEPVEIIKLAKLYLKNSGCTNWNIYDDDDRSDIGQSLWHICGSDGLKQFEVMLAFVWKCAQIWMTKYIDYPDAHNEYAKFFDRHADALGNYKFVIRPNMEDEAK